MNIETFKAELSGAGYQEIVGKSYAPNEFAPAHKHVFAARGLLTAGEMDISWADVTRHYGVGDIFEIEAGAEHAEQYGKAGATYLVGRKFPAA